MGDARQGLLYTGAEAVGGLVVGVALGTLAGIATARWATRSGVAPAGRDRREHDPDHRVRPDHDQLVRAESLLPRMTIVAVMVFFPVMVNTIRGLTNVEPAALELHALVRRRRQPDLRKLRVPNALPYWFTALRIATTLSVIGAVVGEFFGGPLYSLGIYITLETGHSRYPTAWAAIVLACALGIGLYLLAVAARATRHAVARRPRDGAMKRRRGAPTIVRARADTPAGRARSSGGRRRQEEEPIG